MTSIGAPVGRRSVLTGLTAAGVGLAGAAGGALAFAGPAAAATPAGNGPWVAKTEVAFNVLDYGAKGDGKADDTKKLQAAIDAAAAGSGVLFFPPGTYLISAPLQLSAPTSLLGSGMWRTTIKRTTDALMAGFPAGKQVGTLTLQDLGFDGNGADATLLNVDGASVHQLKVRSCRFTNLVQGTINQYVHAAFEVPGVAESEFTDCLWHNPAKYAGRGMALVVPDVDTGRISFIGNNQFLWLSHAMRIMSGASATMGKAPDTTAGGLKIDGAYFDAFWWLIPAAQTGHGATVTYTSTGMTDTAADFSAVPGGAYPNTIYVRAMPVRHSGKITSGDAQSITETGVDFSTLGIKRGEIVRSGNSFAIVRRVTPYTQTGVVLKTHELILEGWLDNDTLLPTAPPAPGDDYTVYGVILGSVLTATQTTLTFDPASGSGGPGTWFDLTGDFTVVPPAGTLYEVMQTRPGYHILTGAGLEWAQVTNSVLRRSHHDMISGETRIWELTNNVFEDGQDAGFTPFEQGPHRVIGNAFKHIGTEAIHIESDNAVIVGNYSEAPGWRRSTSGLAHFVFAGCRYCHIADNSAVGTAESIHSIAGIALANPAPSQTNATKCEQNIIQNNTIDDANSPTAVLVMGANTINNHIVGSSSITYSAGGTGQRLTVSGTGSPEGVLAATVGSTFTRTDGGPGATLYVKESGAGTTGWVAK